MFRADCIGPQRQYFDKVEQSAACRVQICGVEVAPGNRVAGGTITAFAEDPPPMSDDSEDTVIEGGDVASDHLEMEPAQLRCLEAHSRVELSETEKSRSIEGPDLKRWSHDAAIDPQKTIERRQIALCRLSRYGLDPRH